MYQYLDLLQNVLQQGHPKADRTGTGTLSLFGPQMRFNLQEGFPIVTTKRCHLRSIVHELIWFLKGYTNVAYLHEHNVTIWDEWAGERIVSEEEGELPVDYRLAIFRDMNTTETGVSQFYLDWEAGLKEKTDAEIMAILDVHQVPRVGIITIKADGELGPIYGKQWRDWVGPDGRHHDQIANVMEQLKNDPDNRRIIVSAWNVGELDKMALAPCHAFFQFYTREMDFEERESWFFDNLDQDKFREFMSNLEKQNLDRNAFEGERFNYIMANTPERVLSCQLYQRSADMFLGVPFNIASYALLVHMFAQQANMAVGDFVWTGGDVHLYSNHVEQAKLQLTRTPHKLPTLRIKRKPDSIFDYEFDDFEVVGYECDAPIKAPVAI
ncbi:hypothetical protein pEaSNUABM29_00205 [Erwinia phage pEa_SNUABM_29]|nr:hypothetical protein pEaSNUABM29_00205 [Erwinia phage pEa_SNUABM_29]